MPNYLRRKVTGDRVLHLVFAMPKWSLSMYKIIFEVSMFFKKKFEINYEDLYLETEKQIQNLNLNHSNEDYVYEMLKAMAFISFWRNLAVTGYCKNLNLERINADQKRLNALIDRKSAAQLNLKYSDTN